MSCATTILSVCELNCGVPAYKGRIYPINPITAFCHLHNIDLIDAGSNIRDEDILYDEAVQAAELMFEGCTLIRNEFLEAVAKVHLKEAYLLFTRQLAVKSKHIPFTVRAIMGLGSTELAQRFFNIVADELEYFIEHEIIEDVDSHHEDAADTCVNDEADQMSLIMKILGISANDDMSIGLTD